MAGSSSTRCPRSTRRASTTRWRTSERGATGRALAKHPLYPVLLAAADRLGGVTGMVLLSLAGTVAAAGLAAVLARRLDPALVRPDLWMVGLASPLLFDGFLVIAHTLGAALAAAAVLLALRAVERAGPSTAGGRSRRRRRRDAAHRVRLPGAGPGGPGRRGLPARRSRSSFVAAVRRIAAVAARFGGGGPAASWVAGAGAPAAGQPRRRRGGRTGPWVRAHLAHAGVRRRRHWCTSPCW